MKVLQVVQSLEFGGLERVVINLVKTLDRRRFESDILCLRKPGIFADELRSNGLTVFSFNMGRGRKMSVCARFRSFLTEKRYDVVHSHDTTPLIYTCLTKFIYSKFKHVYTEHSGIYSCFPRHKLLTLLAFGGVDRIVTVSQDLKRYYERFNCFWMPKIEVIYNGLDFPEVWKNQGLGVRAEFGIPDHAPIVGVIARFAPQKGLRTLIEAIPEILAAFPSCFFLLVGDGPERRQLEERARSQRVLDSVAFCGFRKDVARLLAAMDVYVLPSLWEGMPIGLIEALTMGKAVVATGVGGTNELVDNGISGYVVEPGSASDLSGRVISFLNSKELRRRCGKNGYEKVRTLFSLRKMTEQYEGLYERLHENHQQRSETRSEG